MKSTSILSKTFLLMFALILVTIIGKAQKPTLSISNESHTSNTYEFDVKITNSDTLSYYFGGIQTSFFYDTIVKNGGIITKDVIYSELPGWLNSLSNTSHQVPHASAPYIIPYIYTGSSTLFLSFLNAYIIPSGQTLLVYRIKLSNTTNWTPNSHFNIQWNTYYNLDSKIALYNPANSQSYICDSAIWINNLANQNLDSNGLINQTATISASANPVYQGAIVNYTATANPSISGQQFKWFVNSVLQNTTGGNIFTYMPQNGDKISATALSVSNYSGCNTDTITMIVNPAINFTNNIWLGNSDNWHDTTNWSLNIIPALSHNVIIPVSVNSIPTYPLLTAPAVCNSITFLSNQAGSAQIIDNGNYLTVIDSVYTQQYLSSNKWHFISSSISDASTEPLINQLNLNQFKFLRTMMFPDTSYSFWQFWSFNSGANTVLVSAGIQSTTPGKGYTYLSNLSDITTLKGTQLNSDNITINILGNAPTPINKGYFVVGNPYQSALSLYNFTGWQGFSSMYPSVWLYDNGNFLVTNGSIGNISVIPPHQAFLVRNISSTSITIPKTAKTLTDVPLYKTTLSDLLTINVENDNDTNKIKDEIFIHCMQGAASAYEIDKDVEKMFGDKSAPQLYSIVGNEKISINNLPLFTQNSLIIPLGFQSGINGNFTINADGINSFSSSVSILLEDTKTTTFTNLNQIQSYAFTADTNDAANRFMIHLLNTLNIDDSKNQGINIYANNKTVYINNQNGLTIKEIVVYNLLGQKIIASKGNSAMIFKLDINEASANFIVKVITNQSVITKKVFIE
jgi:hypothetical protein